MKTRNLVIFMMVLLCSVMGANAQTKSHTPKTTKFVFVNHKNVSIFIGAHSDSKEKSGLTTWTEIKPNGQVSLEMFADSVYSPVVDMTFSKLAFRLTLDPTNPALGENYLESFSKLKYIIHIADTKEAAEGFIISGNKERGIGFKTNELLDNTTTCVIKNNSSVAITFTEPGHPFYGKTLASKDSMNISASTKKQLTSTGFKDSKISIIMAEGDNAIPTAKTLPIFENSSVVILTDEFFDLSIRDAGMKVYPLKLRSNSPIDVTIEGAYDAKGNPTVYVLPGGSTGEKGKIVYVKYGENYLNLKYFFKAEVSQPMLVRATERGTKWLKFLASGPKKGTFILDVAN